MYRKKLEIVEQPTQVEVHTATALLSVFQTQSNMMYARQLVAVMAEAIFPYLAFGLGHHHALVKDAPQAMLELIAREADFYSVYLVTQYPNLKLLEGDFNLLANLFSSCAESLLAYKKDLAAKIIHAIAEEHREALIITVENDCVRVASSPWRGPGYLRKKSAAEAAIDG